MVVDFQIVRSPSYRVAALRWKGPWSDARIHRQFLAVEAWARRKGLRTGAWIFREPAERTWEVAIAVRGTARSEGSFRIRKYPASSVARVVFDPDVVSSAVIHHGLVDWLRWRRRDRTIRSVGAYREVYLGDPWKDKKAYAHTEVQFLVRR